MVLLTICPFCVAAGPARIRMSHRYSLISTVASNAAGISPLLLLPSCQRCPHPLRPLASTRRRTTRPYPSHHSLASLRPHGSAWHGHALSPDTNTTRRPRAQPITTTHHHRDSGHHPLQPPPTAPPTASHRAHHRWPQRAEGGTTRGQRQAEQHRARGARAELWAPPARQDDPAGGASATYSTCATHSTYSTYSTDSADCICSLALLTLPF